MRDNKIERVLGGSLLSVLVKLVFLSLIVGAVMAFLGLTPRGLFTAIANFGRSIINMGSDAVLEVGQWVLAGALVVVPIWLILRLLGRR